MLLEGRRLRARDEAWRIANVVAAVAGANGARVDVVALTAALEHAPPADAVVGGDEDLSDFDLAEAAKANEAKHAEDDEPLPAVEWAVQVDDDDWTQGIEELLQ